MKNLEEIALEALDAGLPSTYISDRVLNEVKKALAKVRADTLEEAVKAMWEVALVQGSNMPILNWKHATEEAIRALGEPK